MKRAIIAVGVAALTFIAVSLDHPPSSKAESVTTTTTIPDPVIDAQGIATVMSLPAPTTTTTTTTTTTPRPPLTTVAPAPTQPSNDLEQMIVDVFGNQASTALRIARCESKMNPNAVSPTNDHGLFQINAHWNQPNHTDPVAQWIGARWSSVYDPYTNTLMAQKIQATYGWTQWSCY